mmetsp:Transcript_25260/g.58860  ORF Transcript_25260/g.58860 Transcript_25260/m.58860 type:complete len:892 (-) Transcript_25260:139-2814(-)
MASDAAAKAAGRVLLPDVALPSRYDIRLEPDLDRFIFDGTAEITLDVREATDELMLHSKELSIMSVTFLPGTSGASSIAVSSITNKIKDKTVTFGFDEVLPVGTGCLKITYIGELNNQMAGFYRSSYTDINGVKKIMGSTQFESIDCRRCFPCWDEPGRKAVFAVTLVVKPGISALSNMPEKSSALVQTPRGTKKEVAFIDSPKMSTYLLACAVGEFDFVEAITKNGVLVRVYTPPGRSANGAFALRTATQCLDLYDGFFGLPYPLPKLDMIAIPEFAMGAMENWGLVTYREADLLIDEKTASNQQRQRVAIVVCHELAHQWFGNLVTMAWWDDLWLNEGFASWCEHYSTDKIYPGYRMWEQFPGDALAGALKLDSLKTSHPIQVPIYKAEEVEEVFDGISYEKGASVIRMAHAVLGHEAFVSGLQQYMQRHQYCNVETFDLWSAWALSSGKPVKEIMSSWTEQMGFPLITVKEFSVDGGVAKIKLEQQWFLSSGEAPPEEKTWMVPLFIRTLKETDRPVIMMSEKALDVEVPVSQDPDEFVLINSGMHTPMRVAYTSEMRAMLSKAIQAKLLSPTDRVGLVMDAYALAKAGKIGGDEAIRFLAGFESEDDYVVWDGLAQALLGFQRLLMGGAPENVYSSFMQFAGRIVQQGWKTAGLGWEPKPEDGHMSGLLRGLMMKLIARFAASADFLEESRRRFELYISDVVGKRGELPDEYRVPVFQAVLKTGTKEDFRKLMAAFKQVPANVDERHIMGAIGFTEDLGLKEEALKWAISGEIKIQDFFFIMGSVSASSAKGLELAWSFLQKNVEHIRNMVKTASPSLMDAVISYCSGGFCSNARADEVERFFQEHPFQQSKRKISQVLEEIRANAAFVERMLGTDITKDEFWSSLS